MSVWHEIDTLTGRERVKLTPMRAIRKKCLDCSYFSAHEVRHCPIERCPLYPYRLGKKPKS